MAKSVTLKVTRYVDVSDDYADPIDRVGRPARLSMVAPDTPSSRYR